MGAAGGAKRERVVLALALGWRFLLQGYFVRRATLAGDPQSYLEWGRELWRTGSYLQEPLRNKMPGMAALVAAGCGLVAGHCLLVPYLVTALCGIGVSWLLWRAIGDELPPRWRLPALVVLVFALTETSLFAIRLLPDLIVGLGALVLCHCLDRSLTVRRPWSWVVLAGLTAGATLYFRPDYLVLVVAVTTTYGVLVCRRSTLWPAVARVAAVLILTGAMVLPWAARNHQLTGRWILFSVQGDEVLWWAFNDARSLDWQPGREPWRGEAYSPTEIARRARREAFAWIRRHPVEALDLTVARLMSHFSPSPPTSISAAANNIGWRPLRLLYRALVTMLHEFWVLAGLTALVLDRRPLPPLLVLITAAVASRLAFPGAVVPDAGRYALLLVPYLATVALRFWLGLSAATLWTRRRHVALIAAAIIALQVVHVARWGWWR